MSQALPVAASAPTPDRAGRAPRASGWTLVLILVGGAGVCVSAYLNVDPDLYWHRVLGAHWISTRSLSLSPDPIAYTPGAAWFPTAWLVEVLYAAIVSAFGYTGVFVLRFLLAVAFYTLLGRFLHRTARPATAALLFFAVGIPASLVVQDRPQTFSLLFVVLLLPSVNRALTQDIAPRLVPSVAITFLWANVHGLWVLVPGLLGLLALARVFERRAIWRHPALAALVCLAAAGLTPVGPRLLLSPFLVTKAAGTVVEWEATALRTPVAWGLAASLALLLICWARTDAVQPRAVVFGLALTAFGLMAYRNAVFASLLLVPLVATSVDRAFPRWNSRITVPRAMVLATVPVLLLAAASTYVQHAHISDNLPKRIASRLAAQPDVRHLVATYNTTGFLRDFGGDHLRLSIDGRSDRYGSNRITAQIEMLNGSRGWQKRLDRLSPDAIVMARTSPLRELLTERGWTTVIVDGTYVLMEPSS